MNQTNKGLEEVKTQEMLLTEAEVMIIQDVRKLLFGRVEIYISDGKPYRKDVIEQRRITPEEGGNAGVPPRKPSHIEL